MLGLERALRLAHEQSINHTVSASPDPVFIVTVVIGTANHYLADAVAGLAVITAGAVAARLSRGVRDYALS